MKWKELTLCHKLWFSNPNICGTRCRKPWIFQTYIFWSNKSHSLKFQRFKKLESKDIGIRKSEFVANSQILYTNIYELYHYLINLPMHYKVYVVMDRKTNLWDYKLNCEGQYVHFLLSEAPCRARGEGSKELGGGGHCTVQVIGWKRSTPQLKKDYQNAWEKISSLSHSFLLRQSHFFVTLSRYFLNPRSLLCFLDLWI